MSTQLDVRGQAYSKIILPLARQEGSKLYSKVYTKTDVVGKSYYQDQIGRWEMSPKGGANSDTPENDPNLSRTRVDILTFADPTGEAVYSMKSAVGLQYDKIIVAALGGTAYRGEAGGTSISFPAAKTVASDFENSGTHTGLTVAKIRRAAALMNGAGVPMGERTFITSATGLEQLLGSTQATSADYNNVKALVNGEINTFMGFEFVTLEDNILTTTSNITDCYAIHKTGVCLANLEELFMKIDERADKGYSKQVYYEISAGAARLEEAKVIKVKINALAVV